MANGGTDGRREAEGGRDPGPRLQNVTVLHSDAIGLVFEVQRTVAEGGTIETVVSQVLVPWVNIHHVLVMEERT